jgi:hypothetical protein
MKTHSTVSAIRELAAVLLMSICLMATSHAQSDLAVFTGEFTLNNQVHWGETILQPGHYSITVGSAGMPTSALVSDSKGRPVGHFTSAINGAQSSAGNALLVREKDGQLRVYSLALSSLGKVVVYDTALAREAVMGTRASQTVPVMLKTR